MQFNHQLITTNYVDHALNNFHVLYNFFGHRPVKLFIYSQYTKCAQYNLMMLTDCFYL